MSLPSDDVLEEVIKSLNAVYTKNLAKFKTVEDLLDTVSDPMSIFVHTVFSGVQNEEEWFKLEKMRRMDKAFTNQIGTFHEKILSSVDGWHKPTGGFDLKNEERKIIVEIKNKHNTMNSGSISNTYKECESYYRSNRDWTIYLAHIIPKKGRINKPWTPPRRAANAQIRVIDGASLYDLVMQEEDALRKTYAKILGLLEGAGLKINETQKKMILNAYNRCYAERVKV